MRHRLKVISGFVLATAGTWGVMQFILPNDSRNQFYVTLIVAVTYFAGAVAAYEMDRKPCYSKTWEWRND